MYQFGGAFSDVDVEPGSNVLIAGPPMTGKYRLALDTLARGNERGDGAIIVTTKDGYSRVRADYADRVDGGGDGVSIVDCVSKQQGTNTSEDARVRFTSSPVDLTGIGIELSELIREFSRRDVTKNRILLHSLSTLLMYSDIQTVFRFLHVFTGRVQSVDALGLFVIDDSSHDQQTLSTLKQLFDGIVVVEQSDEGSQARLLGLGEDSDWRSL